MINVLILFQEAAAASDIKNKFASYYDVFEEQLKDSTVGMAHSTNIKLPLLIFLSKILFIKTISLFVVDRKRLIGSFVHES